MVTWDSVVTKFHRQYRTDLNLDDRIEAYTQTRILKMILENLTMELRREVYMEIVEAHKDIILEASVVHASEMKDVSIRE